MYVSNGEVIKMTKKKKKKSRHGCKDDWMFLHKRLIRSNCAFHTNTT